MDKEQIEWRRLDVGCGNCPVGDVNCDLFIEKSPHIYRQANPEINPKKIPNFVKCDACHLPFHNGAFEEVYCLHLLEHLDKPIKALKELIRVSKRMVIVKVPHRFAGVGFFKRTENPEHKQWFNLTNLRFALDKLELNYRISLTYKFFPSLFCLIRLPYEITVVITKWKGNIK